jgi:hypothetical protein
MKGVNFPRINQFLDQNKFVGHRCKDTSVVDNVIVIVAYVSQQRYICFPLPV